MNINIVLLIFVGFTSCQRQTQTETERPSAAAGQPLTKQKADSPATLSENTKIKVEIHDRVDTTKKEVKAIATLWTNYLNSTPDQISDNPY